MNQETLSTILIVTCLVQTVTIATMVFTIPFLWWIIFSLKGEIKEAERKIDLADEAIEHILEAAGVGQTGEKKK